MTTAEDAWQTMINAEETYYEARMALVAAGPDEVLREQLGTLRGRGPALRVLADLLPDHTLTLFSEVFHTAVSSERDGLLARRVLSRLEPARLSEAFSTVLRDFLVDEQRDSWEYRRTAELLDAHDQTDLLAQLVAVAKRSADSGIRGVGNDFS